MFKNNIIQLFINVRQQLAQHSSTAVQSERINTKPQLNPNTREQ